MPPPVNPDPMSDAGQKWRALALTGLAVILSLTTWFSATAVLPELAAAWVLTPGQTAWLTNAVQAGFVPPAPRLHREARRRGQI